MLETHTKKVQVTRFFSRDFTLQVYRNLLETALEKNYQLIPFEDYQAGQFRPGKVVVLRHDVDRHPSKAVAMSELEHTLGIRGSYYFRVIDSTFCKQSIKRIVSLGHELGYHYEDLTLAKGNFERALELFIRHLEHLRKFYPVKTICMHGSPLSKWDNSQLWVRHDYRSYDVVADAFLDLDYAQVFYLTDTGRGWNNRRVSVRDKVPNNYLLAFKSTPDIITAIKNNTLPSRVLFNTHPNRWNDSVLPWVSELLMQNLKNPVKWWVAQVRAKNKELHAS